MLRGASAAFAILLLLTPWAASLADAPDKTEANSNFFFPVEGAKDCAFDSSRDRLYVTTPKQLMVFSKNSRSFSWNRLTSQAGELQAIDISPDFKYLAVGPAQGEFIFWISLSDMEITQVKFRADEGESGVHDLCVGFDNSGPFLNDFQRLEKLVELRRFNPKDKNVSKVGKVQMNAIVSASAGDRKFAAVAEGNISSGPLDLYSFKTHSAKLVKNLMAFHYEIACGPEARCFAQPFRGGCNVYDAKGGLMGNLNGKPVICAAFHPKNNTLFVMRHGESEIQEYNVDTLNISNTYSLDEKLAIAGDVKSHIRATITPTGKKTLQLRANIRRTTTVIFKTFQSGRLKVSDSGNEIFAVIPTGVYQFAVKDASSSKEAPAKPKFKVIQGKE